MLSEKRMGYNTIIKITCETCNGAMSIWRKLKGINGAYKAISGNCITLHCWDKEADLAIKLIKQSKDLK